MKAPQEAKKLYMVVPEPSTALYSPQRVRYYTHVGYVKSYAQSLDYQKRQYEIYETDVDWKLVASSPSEEVVQ